MTPKHPVLICITVQPMERCTWTRTNKRRWRPRLVNFIKHISKAVDSFN